MFFNVKLMGGESSCPTVHHAQPCILETQVHLHAWDVSVCGVARINVKSSKLSSEDVDAGCCGEGTGANGSKPLNGSEVESVADTSEDATSLVFVAKELKPPDSSASEPKTEMSNSAIKESGLY